MNTIEKDNSYIASTYARFPIEIASGKGSIIVDNNGKEYIDLGTGIAVNSFGLCDDEWIAAVSCQLNKFQHTSNLYYHEVGANLAKALCDRTGLKKVFFGNSGAEANECAIKSARKYAQDKKGKEYYNIVTLVNSFHGRTITTLAATGQDVFHKDFTPLTDGFLYCEANNILELNEIISSNKVAAIMFECVQGEGGVLPLSKEFVNEIEKICIKNDILMIVDEVQTGNGRSGELYAYMNYGVNPDIVTTAKGLGGGLPIGACMFGEKAKDVLGPSSHGSTFGMNPVVCAGALSIINRIDQDLLDSVKEKSKLIFDSLNKSKGIESVSGLGLMIGFKPTKPAKEIVNKCIEKGVICLTAKDKVRLLPALNIDIELLKKALKIIIEVCGNE